MIFFRHGKIQYFHNHFSSVSKAPQTLIFEQKKLTSKPHQGSLRRAERAILIGDLDYV